MPIRLVLIEPHQAVREGLELLLRDRGCDVVGTGGDAEAARSLIAAKAPEVAIVGVRLDGESGIDLTRELAARHSSSRVVLYTSSPDPELLLAGLDAGALGYALKNGDADELMEAIRAVASGKLYVDPRLRAEFLAPSALGALEERDPGVLTPREREIMDFLADGQTGEQVAALLVLSPETVKTHIRNAMVRLDATTRVHAVALGLRDGEISPPGFTTPRLPRPT